jgi:hypothetical protein
VEGIVELEERLERQLEKGFNINNQKSILDYKYQITFEPENVQSGINIFELEIKGEKLQGEFIIEKKMDTQFETILFIIAGIGVLLIGIGFFMKNKKEKVEPSTPVFNPSIAEVPKESEMKPNLSQTIVHNPIPIEIQKTAIASSNVPTLKIVSVNGIQHHRIEKLPLTLGRESYNDIIIQDNSVSKKHAELVFENGYFYLIDLDSTNGLIVNGQKFSKIQLKENEKVYLGNATLELYLA